MTGVYRLPYVASRRKKLWRHGYQIRSGLDTKIPHVSPELPKWHSEGLLRILIVDDNAAVRRLMRTMIRSFAGEIFECAGGVEAISAYHARKPDVALMDIRMDEVDGIQATTQIKAYDPEARVVIVTDYDDDTLRQAAIRAGACGYVLKDNLLDLVRLLEEIQRSLQ